MWAQRFFWLSAMFCTSFSCCKRNYTTLNEYVAELIREFYELKEREGESNMGDTRTLAVQIPAPLFDRLDEYLAKHRLKKKEFIIGLLREALDKVEAEEDNEETGES
jgi:hypothetical protein